MPVCHAIIAPGFLTSIVAEGIAKALAQLRCFRVAVNVAQGRQNVPTVVVCDGNGMVTTFPKVSVSIEQTIEAHRAVPVVVCPEEVVHLLS